MNNLMDVVTEYISGSFASIFIFGVLTGWLIEWLFYNFIWKNLRNNPVESEKKQSTEVKKEQVVDAKKEQLAKDKKEQSIETKQKPPSEVQKKQVVEIKKEQDAKKEQPAKDKKQQSSEVQKEQVVDAKKEQATKDKQEQDIKADKEQATESNQQGEELTTDKSNKSVKKQVETVSSKPTKADDFTKLFGIGPSMSKQLHQIGVNSFEQLSQFNIEKLTKKLTENGARITNKGVLASWSEQAKLADAGDFKTLKALQNKLK